MDTRENNQKPYDFPIADRDNVARIAADSPELLKDLREYKRIYAPLLITVIAMICFGLIMLFSASLSASYSDHNHNSMHIFLKQAVFNLGTLAVAYGIARFVPLEKFRRPWMMWTIYGVTTVLLLYVTVKGVALNNAQRWINLMGLFQFQPSELAKLSSVLFLAIYFGDLKKRMPLSALHEPGAGKNGKPGYKQYGWHYVTWPLLLMGFWIILVAVQPHVSGAFILMLVALIPFLVASIPLKVWGQGLLWLLPFILVGAALAFALYPVISGGESLASFIEGQFAHVKQRAETFEDIDSVSDDQNYQNRQARIAMGAGGLTGLGLGQGRQKYNYLPMIQNDYILPAIAEELGLLGTVTVLLLFILFFFLGMKVAWRARDVFGAIIAYGFTFTITLHALLNFAVASEVIPTTGISLPFFSAGGTSNIVFILEVGLILGISRTSLRWNRTVTENLITPEEEAAQRKEKERYERLAQRKLTMKHERGATRAARRRKRDQARRRATKAKTRRQQSGASSRRPMPNEARRAAGDQPKPTYDFARRGGNHYDG